jgi:hypothetical protein
MVFIRTVCKLRTLQWYVQVYIYSETTFVKKHTKSMLNERCTFHAKKPRMWSSYSDSYREQSMILLVAPTSIRASKFVCASKRTNCCLTKSQFELCIKTVDPKHTSHRSVSLLHSVSNHSQICQMNAQNQK